MPRFFAPFRSLGLATLLLAAIPAFAQSAFVTGVVRAENQPAVSGAIVAAYSLTGSLSSTTVADVLGRYTLSLPPATYRLLAYDPAGRYATEFYRDASSFETSAEVTLAPGASLQNIDFRLRTGLRISGQVVTTAGSLGDSVIVAAYNLDGTRRGFQKVEGSGAYSLLLPAGNYKLAAYDETGRLTTEFFSGKSSYEQADTISLSADRAAVNFSIRLAARVIGFVLDRETRQPLAQIRVEAFNLAGMKVAEDTTRPDGSFSLPVPPGAVKFVASDRNSKYITSYHRNAANFGGAASYELQAGQTLSGINFDLERKVEPSRETTVWISAAANAPGANGTFFLTDLWLFNPNDTAATIRASFLPPGSDNRNQPSVDIVVGAKQQREIRNVLQTTFSLSGAGALRLSSTSRFVATSRTFNKPSNSELVGTFGLAIPGLELSESVSYGILNGLANSAASRTNLGLLNPQGAPITIRIEVFDPQAKSLGTQTRRLEPHEWFQTNLFGFLAISGTVSEAYAVLTSSDGSFFAYASVVDQKSGDGTILLPSRDPRPVEPRITN